MKDLKDQLSSHGIQNINILILNAGAATSFQSSKDTRIEELQSHFEINTLFPIAIYQALRPFLLTSGENRKLIYISSSLGSIGEMEGNIPSLAYGVSKAGANYFVRKVHFEEGELVTLAIHPGYVDRASMKLFQM